MIIAPFTLHDPNRFQLPCGRVFAINASQYLCGFRLSTTLPRTLSLHRADMEDGRISNVALVQL